jgi:hypothetical protein
MAMARHEGGTRTGTTRRWTTVAVSTGLALSGAGLVGTAQAHPIAKAKTGTLIVKVLKGHNRVSGLRMCPYVDGTNDRAGKCQRSNNNGIAKLRHVTAGSIDLITYKPSGKRGTSVFGIIVKADKTKHYPLQTSSVCPGVCS